MKGIILAGGAGTRLYPLTKLVTKQLQPVYDKPMIYYPLGLLMLGGIREIMIISTPHDAPLFQELLGNGSELGISLQYRTQASPRGIPEAFLIAEDFIAGDHVVLILGDNLFHGEISFFREALEKQTRQEDHLRARIFACSVAEPEKYGVVEFDHSSKRILSLEEKPLRPKSHYAVPGLYVFDEKIVQYAKDLRPSARGELEIIDILQMYWQQGTLGLVPISRGVAWLDMGTPKSLLEASSYIFSIEERQGLKVMCLEEIALRMGLIDLEDFFTLLKKIPACEYRKYLETFAKEFSSEN